MQLLAYCRRNANAVFVIHSQIRQSESIALISALASSSPSVLIRHCQRRDPSCVRLLHCLVPRHCDTKSMSAQVLHCVEYDARLIHVSTTAL